MHVTNAGILFPFLSEYVYTHGMVAVTVTVDASAWPKKTLLTSLSELSQVDRCLPVFNHESFGAVQQNCKLIDVVIYNP